MLRPGTQMSRPASVYRYNRQELEGVATLNGSRARRSEVDPMVEADTPTRWAASSSTRSNTAGPCRVPVTAAKFGAIDLCRYSTMRSVAISCCQIKSTSIRNGQGRVGASTP